MHADVLKTQALYRSMAEDALCICAYCRSYRAQVRAAYPEVAAYLDALGIDIEKPFETSPLEPDADGLLDYCGCQYVVLGQCGHDFRHRIGEVELRRAASHPSTGIKEEHFLIELFPIRLKFLSRN